MDKKVRELKDLCEALFREAERDKASWAGCVRRVFPEIVDSAAMTEAFGLERPRLCPHARTSALTLASAMMSYVFPQGHPWFKFGSPLQAPDDDAFSKDEAEAWFSAATDIARAAIERSNFYPEMHSVMIDRCVTGTGLLLIEGDASDNNLYFTHVPAGTYGIAEDSRHQIDTVVRKVRYSLAQLLDEFGYDALHAKVQADIDRAESLYNPEDAVEVWHIVMPRQDAVHASFDLAPEARPYASVYLDAQNDHILSEDGMYEFPYMCTRFVRYGSRVFGVSPLKNVEDTINDLMVNEECMSKLYLRSALPPMVSPAEVADQISFEAGSITVLPMQFVGSQVPRELAPVNVQGLQAMQADIDTKKKEISDAFFTSIFQNISQQDRTMSATEVNAREAEKATNYYPTFTQLQVDMRVFCNRVFSLLVRANEIPTANAPQGIIASARDDEGVQREFVLNPRLEFIGKMSQAMERIQNSSLENFLAIAFQMFSSLQNAELAAQFDWVYIIRSMARRAIPDAKCLLSKSDADRKVKEWYSMQQQQAKANAEVSAAKADALRAQADNMRMQYLR